MKVLIVNCVYGQGSTGKIVADLHRGLAGSGVESVVCYGRGRLADMPGVYKLAPEWLMKAQSLASKLSGYGYGCSPFSTRALLACIEKEQPDVVNLHCVNANTLDLVRTLEYLKARKIRTVLSLHSEFAYTGGCALAVDCDRWLSGCDRCPQFKTHDSQCPQSFFFDRCKSQWLSLKKAYDGFDNLVITCVSPWLEQQASMSPFFVGRKIVTVLNGLDTEIFTPRDASRLRRMHGLSSEKIILHVTPNFYSSIKGGQYVLEVARRLQKERPDCRIIIVGYNGDGSDLPANVIPVPFTRDQKELAEYYSLADVTLLTSRRETFSLVCSESLCCGTPLAGFRAGGPEGIALPQYSRFVRYGEIEPLLFEINRLLTDPLPRDKMAFDARKKYSTRVMASAYKNIYLKS